MKLSAIDVRKALQDLAKLGDIKYADVAQRLDMVSDKEKQPLYRILNDFIKRGECEKVRRGVIRHIKTDPHPAKKTSCMYRLIRANKSGTVTVGDLVATCGVTKKTASEYLGMLTKRGITRRISMPGNHPSKYQMVQDPGPGFVRNDVNAEKLRCIRAAKKEALEKMDDAGKALINAAKTIMSARMSIADIDSAIPIGGPEDDDESLYDKQQ
jgi:predicted transcriptional regulator